MSFLIQHYIIVCSKIPVFSPNFWNFRSTKFDKEGSHPLTHDFPHDFVFSAYTKTK